MRTRLCAIRCWGIKSYTMFPSLRSAAKRSEILVERRRPILAESFFFFSSEEVVAAGVSVSAAAGAAETGASVSLTGSVVAGV
ncbi:hypothetical protein CPB86DRAFT_544096 [Serendipita vermifera]|nr:hypothetical protein CPB86DRAFT_544096 [Serendipita vermifera]